MNIFSTHPPRTGAFFASVQRDLRLFLFMLALVCVYRVIFMAALSNFLASGTPVAEILLANFVGLRLSLKTAGWCAAFAFLFASVPVLIFPSREALFSRVRLAIGAIESLLFSVLFLARFPFYRAFHCTFNTQVMAGA
ncbi:MAG: LTA synthase family protein, partial [Selenomonas sp.]|nr:LTA synthase family protein [Selenomonas sp.]